MGFISNYHTHNTYCDGKNTIEEMVLAAINNGMKYLGISSHAPISGEEQWTMNSEFVERYLQEIEELKIKYKGKIQLFKGLEIDYLKDVGLNPNGIKYIPYLNYYIGSVHALSKRDNGHYCFVDDSKENLIEGIEELYGGSIKAAVKEYYNNINSLIVNNKPDILGHIDIIKKNNTDDLLFNENEVWYRDAVKDVLNTIKKSNTIVEINTGGMPRYGKHAMYPSTFILEEIYKMNIPITMNGDSHHVDHINYYYDEVYKLVKDMGFDNIMILTNRGWAHQTI